MTKLFLLPNIGDIETKAVLKKTAKAHQALAELKGVVGSIPNQAILLNTLPLGVWGAMERRTDLRTFTGWAKWA